MSEETNVTNNVVESVQISQNKPEGKTFSEDYVKSLREEAKSFRVNAKNYEAKLREALELSSDADISNLDNLIKSKKEMSTKMVESAIIKANDRLIKAEIKSLEGYNAKLVEKLLDKSKITIDDDGNVLGVKEALATLEIEFPEIKKGIVVSTQPPNPSGSVIKSELEQLEEEHREAVKNGNLALSIAIKNKIYQLKNI